MNIDFKDELVENIAGSLNESVFNRYALLVFREVNEWIKNSHINSASSIYSNFIQTSKDLLVELLEAVALLQTPLLPTYIPISVGSTDISNSFYKHITNHVTISSLASTS